MHIKIEHSCLFIRNWLYDIFRTENSKRVEYRKRHKFIDWTRQIFETYSYYMYAVSNDSTFAKIPYLGSVSRMADGFYKASYRIFFINVFFFL